MKPTAKPILFTVLTCCVALAACDRKSEKQTDAPDVAQPSGDADSFTWRDAIEASPEMTREKLGDYEGCEPEKALPPLTPTNRQFWLGGPPFCRFESEQPQSPAAYRIDGILYSEGTAVTVDLVPNDTLDPADAVEAFGLPELPVERRTRVAGGDRDVRQVLLRPKSIDVSDEGQVVAVDLLLSNKNPNAVDRARISVVTKAWPSVLSYAELDQPPAVSRDVVLPATTSRRALGGVDMFVSLSQNRMQLTTDMTYPKRASDGDSGQTSFDSTVGATATGDWKPEMNALIEDFRQTQKSLGMGSSGGELTLAADQNVAAAHMWNVMKAAHKHDVSRFEILGRRLDSLDAPFSQFADIGVTKVLYAPYSGAAPGRSRLDLSVLLRTNGIDVYATSAKIPPVDGCPSDGPTVCMADDSIDLAELTSAARKAQTRGDFEEAQKHVRKGVSAYGWAALYDQLNRIKSNYPGETRIAVTAGEGVSVATVMRLVEISRVVRGEGSTCQANFEDNQSLFAASPCRAGRRGAPKPLFPNVLFVGG